MEFSEEKKNGYEIFAEVSDSTADHGSRAPSNNEIVSSNPTQGMDVRIVCVHSVCLCCSMYR
jgi:hypothetical protein